MPLEWFRCPDNELSRVEDCLKSCRMGEECQPPPYLALCAEEREWTGTPSTTQLLNGTMMSYLKLTKPYIVDPDNQAFMIHGTMSHKQLELSAKQLGMMAEFSTTFDKRNVSDLLYVNRKKDIVMVDYKRWGSFRVAKALGIVEIGKQPDPSGEVYKKSGPWGRAGSPKMIPYFQRVESEADNWEAEMQLNRYRIMLEDIGICVDEMRVHAIVRDGGLLTARQRGVYRNTYYIPVIRLDNGYVVEYFESKKAELLECLERGAPPSLPCNSKENWDGVRCRSYCEVWNYCPKGILERKQ